MFVASAVCFVWVTKSDFPSDRRQTINRLFSQISLVTIFPKHNSGNENILVSSIIKHSRTSQIVQIIRNLRQNIRWSSKKMFETSISQVINTIRNTFTNSLIKNRQTFSILFNNMFNRFSRIFCKI